MGLNRPNDGKDAAPVFAQGVPDAACQTGEPSGKVILGRVFCHGSADKKDLFAVLIHRHLNVNAFNLSRETIPDDAFNGTTFAIRYIDPSATSLVRAH
ncbi:hypothetical protein [Rhodospira trueperi]|uniref:hypothetical protein n=1 Tax=Rhodospira trueperi TaxID=69960 RepID=UPI00115FA0FF|nr:hypothetical protein [Rhodospira trueperi]